MPFSKDYYYLKYGEYSIVTQAILDYKKRFIDICIGMLGSVNVWCVLCKFVVYKYAQLYILFDITRSSCEDRIPPYLFGDKGYSLIS